MNNDDNDDNDYNDDNDNDDNDDNDSKFYQTPNFFLTWFLSCSMGFNFSEIL